jgi:hypothetical protein
VGGGGGGGGGALGGAWCCAYARFIARASHVAAEARGEWRERKRNVGLFYWVAAYSSVA